MNQVKSTTVTNVAQALVKVAEAITLNIGRLVAAINVANVSNLDQFEVRGFVGDRSLTLASASGDYTSPKGAVVAASGNLTGLAANATGWLIIDPRGFDRIELWAADSADGPTAVTVDLRGV